MMGNKPIEKMALTICPASASMVVSSILERICEEEERAKKYQEEKHARDEAVVSAVVDGIWLDSCDMLWHVMTVGLYEYHYAIDVYIYNIYIYLSY